MTTKRFLLIPLFFLAIACSSNSDLPQIDKGKELVDVNGSSIRQGYLDLLAKVNPRIESQLNNPFTRRKLLENLVEQELLYQESLRRGLNKNDDVEEKAALYKRVIVAQAVLDSELDKKAKAYYDANKDTEFTKVKIAQIQIDFVSEEALKKNPKKEANDQDKKAALDKITQIKARLDKGEDFAAVAKEASSDKLSKARGGDMGAISKGDKRLARRGLEKLGDAAFALKKDQVSDPVESAKAYHLVKVLSDPEATPFEEANQVIRFQLQKQIKDDLLAQLKQNAKVVYKEEAPAAPGGSGGFEHPGMTMPAGGMPSGGTPPPLPPQHPEIQTPPPAAAAPAQAPAQAPAAPTEEGHQ